MAQDNISKLHGLLQKAGYNDIGSEEQFRTYVSDANNAKKLHGLLQKAGYNDIGDEDAFLNYLGSAKPQPTQQPEVQAENVQQTKPSSVAQNTSTSGGYKPTEQEMMGFNMTINSALGTAKNPTESYNRTAKNIETYQKQQAVSGGVAKSEPKWNPETGQMEQNYITSAGTEYNNKDEAADVQRKINDAYWREAHPLDAAEREINQDIRDIRSEEERLTEQRKAAEGNKRPEDKTWWDYFKEGFGASAVSGIAPMGSNVDRDMVEAEMTRKGAYGAERQAIAKESDVLMARRRLAEEARQLITDVRKDQQGYGFWSGLGRAGEKVLETALNPSTWDFGEADLNSQLAVANAVIKSDSGLGISGNEQKLLDTWAKNAAINSKFGEQLSGWTKAGVVTGESLPFMLEMAMNPASGLGEAATTQLLKYSLKKYGTKWVKDHAKSMLAKKIATRLIGDMVGAGVMASTTGMARVAADYERRMTGQVDIAMDANGDVIYNGIKQDTKENPGAALFKALSSTSIENWSEMAGNYLGFLNNFFGKALGNTVIGKAGRKMLAETGSIEGVSLNKAQKFIYELAAGKGLGAFSEGLKQFADRTQWHGVINEYLEEEIGNIANALVVGDMTLDTAKDTGVFNLQQNIDTFCGVALMGGFMSAMNTVGYAAHRYNYDTDRVSNANSKLFGDELWSRIRTTIDSSIGDPRGLNDTLTDLIGGDDAAFDKDGKKAILKYTQAALEKQGAEMATYQPRMASSEREEVDTPEGKKYVVTSLDKNGETISQQAFDTEDEAMAYEGELKMNQQKRDYNDYLSMTNKLSYPEAAKAVDDFLSEEVWDGASEDTRAATIAAMNNPKSAIGKRFMQFKTERILEKAEANRAAIEAFEEENGWTPGTVAWLGEQDPMQLDAEGLQMMDQARTFLEGLAYPAGEFHVEHEQQVGAETAQAVVENVISEEVPIEPGNNAGSQLLESFVEADNALTKLFERNEDLKEEYTRLVGMGLSPQEVISSLDSFRPEEVQAVIDHFNAKARYLSFMDEAAREIDNVANRSRQRHTFKGTIDGVADLNNVHQITDGTNHYFLVSGDITTDPATGRITGSTSGLIIGMDLDGSFVQLNESDGYSVEPVTMSLDQFEEAERIRLQKQVTNAIDPNGAMNQQTEQQTGEVGGEAGANTGTGANEPSTPAPVTETPQEESAQPQQPAVTIESVTDKDGVKRYELGIPIDDAIADMQADNLDVNEESNLAINEAQAELNKIKQPKTRAERVKNAQRQQELQNTIDYYNKVKERFAEQNQPAVEEQPSLTPSGLTVEEQKQLRIAEAKAKYGELFDDDFTKANDVFELVSMWIGRNRNLAWTDVNGKRGLQKELGWTRKIGKKDSDTKYIETLLAKNGEGVGVDEFVHAVWESPENDVYGEKRYSTEEIKEALLELLKSAQSKSDVVDFALNSRIVQAEAALQQQAQMAEEQQNIEPSEVEPAPDGGLPFGAPTNEDFTNDVNENNNEADNNVSLQQPSEEEKSAAKRNADNLRELVSELTDKYSSQPIEVIDFYNDDIRGLFKELFDKEPTDQELQEFIEDSLNMDAKAVFIGKTGKVYVFAHNTTPDQIEEFAVFHENIHPILESMDEEATKQLYKAYWDASTTEEAERDKAKIKNDYPEASEEEQKEEFFVHALAHKMHNGTVDKILDRLNEDQKEIVNDVLELIGYDRQQETAQRRKADEVLDEGELQGGGSRGEVDNGGRVEPLIIEAYAPNEEEYGNIKAWLDLHPGASVAEIQRHFKIGYSKATIAKRRYDNEKRTNAEEEANEQPNPKIKLNTTYKSGDNSIVLDKMEVNGRGERIYIGTITTPGEGSRPYSMRENDFLFYLNNGNYIEEPQETQTRKDYLASHPLTEEQIMADTEANEDEKLNAIDFLNGEDDSAISRFYYDGIYERAQKKAETISNRKARFKGKEEKLINDPMAAIEDAARLFRGEQEQKSQDQKDIDDALKEFNDFLDNAKGSNVLDKFMRKGLEGNDKAQANLLDAFTLTNEAQRMFLKDLLRHASKVGYAYIKSGIHDVQAWSKKMSDTIGRKLNEVLGWDDAIVNEFVDEVWNQKYTVDGQRMRLSEHAERLKNGKGTDTTVNVNKQKNNETENVVSSQQKPASELEGDSAEFAERQEKEKALRDDLKQELLHGVSGDRTLKTMQDVKKLAEKRGLDMSLTDLQEIVEAVIVDMARNYANNSFLTDKQKFDNIVALYQTQPTLSARDNDRINKQQYSTPAPMAYLMGLFASKDKKVNSGLEPSAGNGMLTINLPKEKMHVNDIDEMRLSNLQKQGFGEVTSQDGLQSFGDRKFDVVVTNPPFGNVTPNVYDGIYEISGLEHQMAINALESMKDDGRAAIIIGGNTEYNQNGSIKGKDRAFLNYLYAHYNVVDVINMDGKTLYSRQGTGFPVRMILINGRKEFNPRSFAPVIQKARAERVNSYDELFKRVNDDILSDNNKPASVHDTESGESRRVDDTSNAGASTQTGVRNVQPTGSQSQPAGRDANGSSVSGSSNTTGRTDTAKEPVVDTRPTGVGSRTETSQPSRPTAERTEEQRNESRGNNIERPAASTDNSQRVGQRGAESAQQPEQPAVKRGLGTEKVPYRKQSGNPFTLQSLMPAEQADVVKSALEELGDVDQFLVDELGYSSKEELHQALAAEQIDSVALAIHQMNQGSAFIIGDQTGIGKGRQAAALIRYGVKKGGFPVFITVKKALFSDMYRDLCDIGSPKLRPFIWSADDTEHSGNVTDKNGNVIYQTPNAKEQKRVVDYINKNGKLPPEYDYVLTTYDSFKSGTMDYEDGQKKSRNFGKKKVGPVHINGQAKRDALETLAGNSYVIMDESHNAGGEGSNVSNYLQYITTKAKGLTFLSATFAKRPGNMPIYSLKTAISKAGVSVGELIDAVKRGGATFQEIMSKALTEAGQMIRRERNMEGVTIDWRGIEDESVIQKQREQYDTIIGLFNDIISFQRAYVDPIVNGMNDAAAEEQGEVDHTPGTRDMGINNTPFASRTYNMVQQVLLSLKAEEAAKRAIEHLKLGRKPVITVANTNEGAADEAAGMGEAMEMPDLSVNLKKGLQGTLRITKKDAFGNTVNEMIPFDRLSEEGRKRYQEIMDAIENASSGLSLSPIDVIKNELKKAGYKVGELTGRKAEFVYNEDGTVNRVKRQDTDKKRIAADFNNGNLDALILNRSAGTGISLHASSTFKDQRQRIMIVAQAQGDVNDEVQIRGRIDRTGQVLRGMYEYVVSQIPSEQRLLMMLKAKLRSLDANTTSSQKSKFNEMQVQDIINKYGDDIVIQYLAEHPDLAMKMCDPLKWGEGAETLPAETLVSQAQKAQGDGATASKVLGRMALLTVKEQEKMLQEIGDLYQAEIDRLNEMGENDLEITEMPLKAKTLKKDVWEEGVEPGGKNPFADNSYVEEVEMDVLKKPMKAEEVKRSQERLLGGKSWDEYKQSVLDRVDAWAEQKKAETTKTITERAEKKATAEKEKYAKGAKKAQEKNGMTDEEIERNAGYQYDTFYKQEMEKLQNAIDGVDKQKQAFVDALETFSTEGVYALPTDIYDLSQITFEPSFGKVIDIKISDNFSTTASTISFATLDGRRKITIPISGMVKQQNGEKRDIKPIIIQQTAQTRHGMFGSNVANTLKVLERNVDNWDKLTSTATRKKGHIITGNLLKALTSLRSQGKGGKLISYTTDTGEVRQGILMSDQFDPGALTSKSPISSAKKDLDDWEKDYKIVSADGDVTIKRGRYDWRNNTYDYILQVPKSKKKGDKYFNDKTLLGLMDGQFEGSSKMSADFPASNLDAVLKRLDELGVTVEGSKEDNNSQNTLSRNIETEESGKKELPLERRTMKSYTDKEGNYHEGIDEELGRLESVISGTEGETESDLEEGTEVLQQRPSAREINDLRKQAANLRAEKARRSQKKQELRDKYNINEKGDISLDDLSRMFHDLNNNKLLGKLFDKVVSVLKNLGVEFRFSDNMKANVGGKAMAFINTTFYNWDSQLRDLDNQEKARILLHEMIHNVASQILFRYEMPELGELTSTQKAIAKQINDIYNAVKAFNPVRENGKSPYGLEDVHEMVSELANPEFRDILDSIPYKGSTIWQKIKNWLKKLIPGLNEGTAFNSLSKAFDDLLDTYDEWENNIYRQQRAGWEKQIRDAGYYGNYVDFWESDMNGIGRPYIVEDKAEISRLDKEPKEKGYRTVVQNSDGTFGSPMAGRLGGKKGESSKPTSSYKMNQWERSEENPHLANDKGKINLIKPGGLGTVGNVDYNPYIHIRENKLNKQFKNAWERPDLVYIEVEYPKSEMTSGYRAEKAAKTVGRHKWPGGDLILSRWDKPVRIVPWEEVADDWEREFGKRGVEFDIVSPHLLPILAERGVEILPPHKNMGEECNKAYEKFKARQAEDPMNAIRMAARQFGKKQVDDTDPIEAIRRAADKFRKESNINNPNNPANYSAKAVYDERLNRVETVFSEAYQDAMVSLKTAQNAIAGDKDIPDSQNAYMAENLMHGKNKNEQDLYNREYRDPLIHTINEIMNLTGMNWGDIDRYVYTKSGLERNREFYVRDWLEAERNKTIHNYDDLSDEEKDIYDRLADRIETDFDDGLIATEEEKVKKLERALQEAHDQYVNEVETNWNRTKENSYQDLKDGKITFPDYLIRMDNFITQNIDNEYNPAEHDYSGFREMFGNEDGEYDEADIIAELMTTESQMDWYDAQGNTMVDNLWNQINAATRYGLERYREAGMRSDEQIDQIEQMFHFYVPMRGFKNDTGEDMYQYFTGKDKAKNYVGGLLKHAKGRGSEANYPISTIFAMSYKAISDCNQNLVNQKFYRLCQANPNDLVVLSDSWAVLNEITGEWEESSPNIPDDATEDEVREITKDWEDSMRQLALDNKAKKIKGKERFDYKPMDKKKQSEHIVDVRINGQPRKMIVTGNPRMAQALNGQLRFEHGKNVFSKWNATIKNFMASVFTSYSPTFALRNMFRDWTHFRMMLGVREGKGYAKQANKYYRQSLFKMVGLFKKYREGTLNENDEMERDFKDFMDNGGITGFVFMQKIDDIQKEMENIYKKQKAGKPIRLNDNLWEKILGAVEALNEGIENNARFATYRTSRHYAGRTKARSAYDAKEITVNFNKKGAGGKTAGFKSTNKMAQDAAKAFGVTSQILGEGKIFFNATVQAIATTFKNFQNADGSLNKPYIAKWAAKYALPPFMFGLLLPMINKILAATLGTGDGDDDPYANLAEWTRRKNLCFYIGNNNFITIPIGQELAAFLALGDIVAGNTYAPDLKPIDRSWDDEMLGVMSTFSPVDIDTKITKGGLMENPLDEVTDRTFSVLAPLVAVQQNLGWTGRPIYREDVYQNDKYNPEYQMVYQSTNPVMVGASKLANDLSGGDDVVRGKIQVNPAIVQYLWEQYTGGPGKVFSNTISIGKDAKDILSGNESDFNLRKVEGLKAFVSQGDDRTAFYRANAKYRKYLEDARELKDAENGYKQSVSTDPLAATKLEKMSASEDYVRMEIVLEAEKSLSKINKAANQAEGKERKELRQLYNQQVKEVVDYLDEVGK